MVLFHQDPSTHDGRRYECMACQNSRNRRSRALRGRSIYGRSPHWGVSGIALLLVLALVGIARAQYTAIPNFTGQTAGQQFRNAINNKFSGADTSSPQLVHLYFYQLPATVTNGVMYYINDGSITSPCAGGGTGAVATGVNGVWNCASSAGALEGFEPANLLPAQTGAYNAHGFKYQNLGAPTTTGDALSEGTPIGAITPAAATFSSITGGASTATMQGVTVNGRIPPSGFAGADLFAKIQAAEAYCAASYNACDIDVNGTYLTDKSANATTRIVISVPTHLHLSGSLLYNGAGNAAGAIEFAAGSDGSEMDCSVSGMAQNDPLYNYGLGGSNNYTRNTACDLTAEFSSGTGNPVIVIDPTVSRVRIHDMNVQGDSTVTTGLINNGADGNIIERVSFSHVRNGGTPSNPTGAAMDNEASTSPQNGTVIRQNVVLGWTKGLIVQRTGGGNVGVDIENNVFALTGGQQMFVNNLQATRIIGNQFLSMIPAVDNVAKIEFGAGTNQNILFQDNHSECDNQGTKNGIVELQIDAGTYRSNSFINNSMHGNGGCNALSTHDPDHIIDWAATTGWNNVISGNDFAQSLHGVIHLAAGSPVAVQMNHVTDPIHGETACTAEPGPGDGCLLNSGSALPTLGQGSAPLHYAGYLGAFNLGASTLLQDCTTMQNSGALTLLTLTTDLDGTTCATAPTYNVRNNTQAVLGTGKAAGTTSGQVTQAETLTYSAGDQICLVRTVAGASCGNADFGVSAQSLRID